MPRIVDLEVEDDQRIGTGGFLTIRRLVLRNRRDDGSLSASYSCDVLERPVGLDAVVVVVFTRARGRVEVLLRDGLRPGLVVGRAGGPIPVPDARRYLLFTEVVAGIVEAEDRGEEGVRRRAALEVAEEAGFAVEADEVTLLGAPCFLAPGTLPEKVWLASVEVRAPEAQSAPDGDGSPMEEGAETRWMGLDEAIAACVRGEIEDAKTELILRRLRDQLAG